jgi:hypothetical protein
MGMRVHTKLVMIMELTVVNFAKSKNLVVKSTMFPHRSIHKYTWTSPDGKTHNQIDHILIDRRRHSSILDVGSFTGADCDSDNYLVVAKGRERLAVSKQMVKKMDVERFNLKQLHEEEVKEQYQVKIKNKFAALENLDDNGDINRAWETTRENIRISAEESIRLCESKSYKPWFNEECLKLVDRRKQAKLQWLQEPSLVNEDNVCNVRREDSRHFRNKKREYLKDKINEIELNSKNKNIRDLYRGITEFKKSYQHKTNLVKDERGDLIGDHRKILIRWKNYFCQLLNVQGPRSIKQTEIHTAEPFVPEPSATEVEGVIRKMKMYKATDSAQIPAELIQAGGKHT